MIQKRAAAAQAAAAAAKADARSATLSSSERMVKGGAEASRLRNAECNQDPSALPSLAEIKRNLPADVFKADTGLSLYYAARDAVMMTVMVAGGRWLWVTADGVRGVLSSAATVPAPVVAAVGVLVWLLYALVLGTVMWGTFVVGHDCGHGSFSRNRWLNVFVGSALHSSILTPFVPWKLTHRSHHKNTGNIDKDEVFMPIREHVAAHAPVLRSPATGRALFGLGLGWFYYLVFGYQPKTAVIGYHYWPASTPWPGAQPITDKPVGGASDGPAAAAAAATAAAVPEQRGLGRHAPHRGELAVSHGMYVLALYALYQWVMTDGLAAVLALYAAPLFVFATWLVMVTFLHHNERGTMRWFSNETWTYVSGQLSTVDRSFGALVDNISHDIGTHQIHHLYPIIPHYKLRTAAAAFRKAYPHLVRSSDENPVVAFHKNAQNYGSKLVVANDAGTAEPVVM